MIAAKNLEALRPAFEAYIRSERGNLYLERFIPPDETIDGKHHDYRNDFVQEAWEAWCAAKDINGNSPGNPAVYDVEMDMLTICGVKYAAGVFQDLGLGPIGSAFEILERNGTITLRRLPGVLAGSSHVHCQCCHEQLCPGVRAREAIPDTGLSPQQILEARAEGRAEALELLTETSAEKFSDDYLASHQIADTGDYDTVWNTDKLRALFRVADYPESQIDRLNAVYWSAQGEIADLKTQLNLAWLPIAEAEMEKDGRYILAWFESDEAIYMRASGRERRPFVAAVRWGSDSSLWGFPGVGGLKPTKFLRITGPDGKPIGFIRSPGPTTV